ncbi:MAG: PTS sugar transporter subunit IIC, partial [bacterium]
LNTGIIHKFEKKVKSGKGNYIILIQIFAVFSKIIRDFVLYSALFFLGIVLAAEIFMSMPIQIHNAFGLAFWMLPAVGFAVVFDMFKTGAGIKLYAVVFLFSYILFSIQNVNIYFFALALAVIALIVIYNSIWNRKEA